MAKKILETTVLVEHPAWRKAWPRCAGDIESLIRFAFERVGVRRRIRQCEISIVLTSDRRQQNLNHQFRGLNKPTNVLSFPDSEVPLGGISIALETVRREAKFQKKLFREHSKHMILHGFLHLLGYDHVVPKQARLMEQIEIAILAEFGISNPYLLKE